MDQDQYTRSLEVLGLQPGSPPSEIRAAFEELSAVWQPDRFPNSPRLQKKARQKLTEIEDAYAFLAELRDEEEDDYVEEYVEPARKGADSQASTAYVPRTVRHWTPKRIPVVPLALFVIGLFLYQGVRSGEVRIDLDRWLKWPPEGLPFLPGSSPSGSSASEPTASARAPARVSVLPPDLRGMKVTNLPLLTKEQVVARYGAPEDTSTVRWVYPRFTILFQDSLASLMVEDTSSSR